MASARASATRWACPPDSARGRWPAWAASPTRSNHSLALVRASCFAMPLARSPKATFSRAVRLANSR